MAIPILARERRLSAALAAHPVLLGGELFAPFGIGFFDWFIHKNCLQYFSGVIRQPGPFAAHQCHVPAVWPALETVHHVGQARTAFG